jgi:hypothetical protein
MARYRIVTAMAAAFLCAGIAAAQSRTDAYEIGGPLQGVPLKLFPTQHGEKPGYPGCVPALQKPEGEGDKVVTPFTSEGLPPERQLHDASVEHFRAYWFKYLPVKNFFDRQSLLKNWPAKDLPGASAAVQDYAEPLYWVPRHREPRHTGLFNAPVKVVRCKVNAPEFALDLGTLPPSLYVVRVIGAVETKDLVRHRRPLILRMTVNDGLNGEPSTYRFRCKYVDEFYVLAELYFNAPTQRAYKAVVAVEEGSLVEPLVHNIELHDTLAGHERRAIKTRTTLGEPPAGEVAPVPLDDTRLARDAEVWEAYPPLNAQVGTIYGMGGDDGKSNWPNIGAGGLAAGQLAAEHGAWTAPRRGLGNVLMLNDKLKLEYTLADYRAGKPLPDPYPFKDRGQGVYTPEKNPDEKPQNWYPVADAVRDRKRAYLAAITTLAKQFADRNNAAAGHEAAVMLCRVAYSFPAEDDPSNAMSSVMLQPGPYGRDMGCRRRDPRESDRNMMAPYDNLFALLKADDGLAKSVGRFIPWVRTPQDVVKLIDTYMVQTAAKRSLRYHEYSSNEPAVIVTPAIVLGDRAVTDPWMEWLFSSTFIYPLPPSGIQDLIVTGNDRDGIGYIGSYSYAMGEQAAPKAAVLERYLATGGNPKFDLRNAKLFPKPVASCYWFLDTRMAGLYFPRIGDVAGPDKAYGAWWDRVDDQCRRGWRWTKDPEFAYVLKHFGTRAKDETDADWAEIEKAADSVKRAPWLDRRSRVVSQWFGLLESGIAEDDFRFRRAAMLRIGQGWGHQHADTLDLQLYAHGYPMTVDGGQRGGYSAPADGTTRVHNLVEVDAKGWTGHSWINALSDAEGARYLRAEAAPPLNHANVKFYGRQIALVDVDEGQGGGKPFTPAMLRPQAKLDPAVISPNSYLFDVARVSGGKTHTYCFHGAVEDELVTNAAQKVADDALPEADAEYLRMFKLPENNSAGVAPEVAEATWRMCRGVTVDGGRGFGAEPMMAQGIWNPNSMRKYTRLHLFDHAGDRMMTGALLCRQWGYRFTNLFVQQRSEQETDAVFPALVEPYVGEPFITSRRTLPVAGNEKDALRAVAVEVKTRNGHTDLLLADGRPDRTRELPGLKAAAEFACVSADGLGLRLATLTGGTLLETPEVALKPAARERTGKIVAVDYPEKRFTLDAPWPAAPLLGGRVFEVGLPGHKTSFTVARAQPAAGGTQVTATGPADFYLSRVLDVDPQTRKVQCALSIPFTEKRPCPGQDRLWVATNEAGTKFWRADYLGAVSEDGRVEFQLNGPVAREDFGQAGALRLWEYGPGDTVRQSTFAALRRIEPGLYELTADVDLEFRLPGAKPRTITVAELVKAGGAIRINAAR